MNKTRLVGLWSLVAFLSTSGCSCAPHEDGTPQGAGAPPRENPMGTFSSETESAILRSTPRQPAATSATEALAIGLGAGVGTPGVHARTLAALGVSEKDSFCPALTDQNSLLVHLPDGTIKYGSSCACPGGGQLYFDVSGVKRAASNGKEGKIDIKYTIETESCSVSGTKLDGTEWSRVTGYDEERNVAYAVAGGAKIDGSGARQLRIYDNFDITPKRYRAAIEVSDGTVLVEAHLPSPSGDTRRLTVSDKASKWECTSTDVEASCTNDKGERRDGIRFGF